MDMFRDNLTDILILCGKIAAVVVITLLAVLIVDKTLKKVMERHGVDSIIFTFLKNVIKVVFFVMALVVILEMCGVKTTSIIAVMGVCGAAVALSLQGSLSNVASGIVIATTRPFKKGDYVVTNGVEGSVDDINLMVTTLKTVDNRVITIPNAQVTNSVIVNNTKESLRRVDHTFAIAADADFEKAKEVVSKLCAANSLILTTPAPESVIETNGDFAKTARANAQILLVKCWCKVEDYWDVYYYIIENIPKALREAEVKLPTNNVYVHEA